jgi:general stress protein YciG
MQNTERRGKKWGKRVFAADRERKSMGKNGGQKTKVGNKPTDNVYA